MTMVKIILVTGGTGCVGHGIQHALINNQNENEKWIFVGSKDADLTDFKATFDLFEKYHPTHVVHLAATVGGIYKNMTQNLFFLRSNMAINDNVLKCSNEFGIEKVLTSSSTVIYPMDVDLPINENSLMVGDMHGSNFGYAWGKRFIDILNYAYNESNQQSGGTKFISFIPCNIFGPFDNFSSSGHIIPSIINRINKAKSNNDLLTVFGSGKAERQFIYSRDLGRLIIWLLRNYEELTPIILAPDQNNEISIKKVVEIVVKLSGFEGPVTYDTTKSDGCIKRTVDNGKLVNLINQSNFSFQFTPFEQAIDETLKWFEKFNE